MSSQLNVDTIVDKAGSGGTNVKVANTSTYVSDGGATTQNTVQGLAKQWIQFDFSSFTVDDSLNVASVTDVGVGRSQINATNAFGSVNRAGASQGTFESGEDGSANYNTTTGYLRNSTNTSQNYMNFWNRDGTLQDGTNASGAMFGDLA